MESIIIFEDDDPITIIKSEDSEPLIIESTATRIAPDTNRTDPKNRRLVPIEKLLDKTTVGEMSLLNEQAVIERCPTAPTNFILHPIVFNSGMMTVPSLSANILNGRLVTSGQDTNIVVQTPNIALQNGENIDFISDPGRVTNVLKMLSHQDASKVHIFTSLPEIISNNATQSNSVVNESHNPSVYQNLKVAKVTPTNILKNTLMKDKVSDVSSIPDFSLSLGEIRSLGEVPSLGVCEVRDTEGSAPQLRTDRIDWEDKIPMDVISFVVSCT